MSRSLPGAPATHGKRIVGAVGSGIPIQAPTLLPQRDWAWARAPSCGERQ
jgi:hypothetical protein